MLYWSGLPIILDPNKAHNGPFSCWKVRAPTQTIRLNHSASNSNGRIDRDTRPDIHGVGLYWIRVCTGSKCFSISNSTPLKRSKTDVQLFVCEVVCRYIDKAVRKGTSAYKRWFLTVKSYSKPYRIPSRATVTKRIVNEKSWMRQ